MLRLQEDLTRFETCVDVLVVYVLFRKQNTMNEGSRRGDRSAVRINKTATSQITLFRICHSLKIKESRTVNSIL